MQSGQPSWVFPSLWWWNSSPKERATISRATPRENPKRNCLWGNVEATSGRGSLSVDWADRLFLAHDPHLVAIRTFVERMADRKRVPVGLLIRCEISCSSAQGTGALQSCQNCRPDELGAVGDALQRFQKGLVDLQCDGLSLAIAHRLPMPPIPERLRCYFIIPLRQVSLRESPSTNPRKKITRRSDRYLLSPSPLGHWRVTLSHTGRFHGMKGSARRKNSRPWHSA